jgi:hypothetical protein
MEIEMSDRKHAQSPFMHRFDQLGVFENGRTPVLLTEAEYQRAQLCADYCAGIDGMELETRCEASVHPARSALRTAANLDGERQQQQLRIQALEAALRPFANYACDPACQPCDCNNCKAQAALAKPA